MATGNLALPFNLDQPNFGGPKMLPMAPHLNLRAWSPVFPTLIKIAMCDNKKPSTVYLPPLTNFTFGSKEPQYEKDPSVSAR
ncbi:hypothetical protein ACHWQZ_G007770 [Mnemiopsis leidyi]